jgi:DNA-binding IclR family transcriptional regulator
MPEPERERLLAEMTFPRRSETTITDRAIFRKELEKVRKQGYGVDQAEGIVAGLHCVSCPVLNHLNDPVAALTVVAPAMRMPPSDFPKVAKWVKPLAYALSKKLGYDALDENGEGKRISRVALR